MSGDKNVLGNRREDEDPLANYLYGGHYLCIYIP